MLNATELIDQSYVLEVSSPGVDRPIVSEDDYRRNSGRRVVVETLEPIDGRSRFRGLLLGLADGWLRLATGGEDELRIPLVQVARARQDVEF